MKLKIIDEDRTRRGQIDFICKKFSSDVTGQETNISCKDLCDPDRSRLIFLHWNNYSDRAICELEEISKEVILYSGSSFRDLSAIEQSSGKVFKIHRIIGRGAPFSDYLKQGFIEILEYFKNGKRGKLPSLLVKASYHEELFSAYLVAIAKEKGVVITLSDDVMSAARKEFEKLSSKSFDEIADLKSVFEKISEECVK